MPSSLSTILSPAPPSPFSPRTISSSSASHYTSDELPDLGAFNTVLREWVHLQPYPRIPQHHSRQQHILSETDIRGSVRPSTIAVRSTVWNQRPIAGYLQSTQSHGRTHTASDSDDMSQIEDNDETNEDDDEGEDEEDDTEAALTVEIADDDDHDGTHLTSLRRTQPPIYFPDIPDDHGHQIPISASDDPDLDMDVDIGIGIELDTSVDLDAGAEPSLGYLDGALSFIAAERERARWSARHGLAVGEGEGERKWRHVIEPPPHRTRRRVRKHRAHEEPLSIEREEAEPSTIKGSISHHSTNGILYAYDSSATTTTTTTTTAVESTSLKPKPKPKPKSKSKFTSKSRPKIKINTSLDMADSDSAGKVKGNSMPYKILAHSRSTPVLGSADADDADANAGSVSVGTDRRPRRRRTHLLELVHVLKGVFPEDVVALEEVRERLEVREKGRGKWADVSDADRDGDMLVLDVRGRDAENGREDPLVHVFVDHSNILIGLLTHLKKHPPRKDRVDKEKEKGTESRTLKPKPPKPKPPNLSGVEGVVVEDDESGSDPRGQGCINVLDVLGKAKATNEKMSQVPVRMYHYTGKTPIPLPSFATAGRALGGLSGAQPGASHSINAELKPKAKSKGSSLSRSRSMGAYNGSKSNDSVFLSSTGGVGASGDEEEAAEVQKRQGPRLSHTALALILERGRPITRRVLVTSSPLYQPMDMMERLGYEVRVYMRVPDLGDGMDRERHHHHHHKRGASMGTGTGTVTGDSPKKLKTHARRVSWSTSTESASASASASAGAGEASRSFSESSPPGSAPARYRDKAGSHDSTISGKRVRYREQGVDELLQLKLHQALAATDDVREGATIVLATGDGNVGQFSEDGFLGPVRTALRRGWKVELYAWEEGLSRAWRREFGEESEWGTSGMFRIVRMEQFAERLVERGL